MEVLHSVVPGLTRVSIDLPAIPLLGSCPVGDFEALEDVARFTVESNISDALLQSGRVEVLRVDVVHEIRLLVELVHVEVLDTDADLTGLFDVKR